MKKAKYPPFSNGSEYMFWEERNCDQCVKASRYNEKTQDYTKIKCAVQRDIFNAEIGTPVSQRTYDACQQLDCPYKKTEWPKRKLKEKVSPNQLQLFDTEKD